MFLILEKTCKEGLRLSQCVHIPHLALLSNTRFRAQPLKSDTSEVKF